MFRRWRRCRDVEKTYSLILEKIRKPCLCPLNSYNDADPHGGGGNFRTAEILVFAFALSAGMPSILGRTPSYIWWKKCESLPYLEL